MKKINILLLFTAALLISACQSQRQKASTPKPPAGSPEANLTQSEAEARAQATANVRYRLRIDLNEKDDQFQGEDRGDFDWNKGGDLFLDFKDGAKILSFSING